MYSQQFVAILRILDVAGFHVYATAMIEEWNRTGTEERAGKILGSITGILVPEIVAAEPPPATPIAPAAEPPAVAPI